MAPELVACSAGQGFKKYPGGAIALPAVDWIGAARGTLSTESDSRSITGTVVRDTQKVSTANLIDTSTSMSAADDTLTIDLADIPIEVNVTYLLCFSILTEGNWDSTVSATNRAMNQQELMRGAALRWFGDSSWTSESDATGILYVPRLMPHYSIVASNGLMGTSSGTHVLSIRAYSMTGTTIEWLLDQVFFLPVATFGVTVGDWESTDFQIVSGDIDQGLTVDGADGGDNLGKFTVQGLSHITADSMTFGASGGGDYQKKDDADDAEYSLHVFTDDGQSIEDSRKAFPNNEPVASYCYGVHGPFLVPHTEWMNDPFSRTIGDGNFAGANNHFETSNYWGTSPEGFKWKPGPSGNSVWGPFTDSLQTGERYGNAVYTDGSKAVIHIRRKAEPDDSPFRGNTYLWLGPNAVVPDADEFAHIEADNLSWSGKFSAVENAYVIGLDSPNSPGYNIQLGLMQSGQSVVPTYYLGFDVVARTWAFKDVFNNFLVSETSLGFWTGAAEVGFRIEVYRYRVRARVWDASGAEPSTWDYDNFRRLYNNSTAYPYTGQNQLNIWNREADLFSPHIRCYTGVRDGTPIEDLQVWFDDMKVEHNTGGEHGADEDDPTSTHFQMEHPDGNILGEIEIPYGAQQIVYWGAKDFTEFVVGDDPYIEFAHKAWSETGAPAMQRAETLWWVLRSVHFNGKAVRVWPTGDVEILPREPQRIRIEPDGTITILGAQEERRVSVDIDGVVTILS